MTTLFAEGVIMQHIGNYKILNTQIKRDGVCVFVILLVGLTSLNWFRGEYLINPTDFSYQVNPVNDFLKRHFAWQDGGLLGGFYDWRGFGHILTNTLPFLAHLLGFSIYSTEKIIFYILYSLSGISSYFVTRHLLSKRLKYSTISSLIAANFYMMNPFVLAFFWGNVAINGMYLYSINPLLIFFFIKGLSTLKFKYVFYFALSILWASPSLSTPTWFAGTILFIIFIFLAYCFINKSRIKNYILIIVCFIGVSLLLNMYWVIYYGDLGNITNTLSTGIRDVKRNIFPSALWANTSFINIFRMIPHALIHSTIARYNIGDVVPRGLAPYILWWAPYYFKYYFVLIFIILNLIFFSPSILINAGFYTREQKYFRIILLILTPVFMFLAKGLHAPFGSLFEWLYYNFPGFVAFRGPDKFLISLCLVLSCLIGFSIHIMLNKLSLIRTKIFVLLMFFLLNIYFFPMWLGFTSGIHRSKIPDYYFSFSKEINSNEQIKKVLVLPDKNFYGNMGFKWNHGFMGIDVLWHLIKKPTIYITNLVQEYNDYAGFLNFVYGKDFDMFVKILLKNRESLNINAIVLHKDMDYALLSTTYKQEYIENILDKNLDNLATKKQIGELILYEIQN